MQGLDIKNGIEHLKNFKGDVKKFKHMILIVLKVSLINKVKFKISIWCER